MLGVVVVPWHIVVVEKCKEPSRFLLIRFCKEELTSVLLSRRPRHPETVRQTALCFPRCVSQPNEVLTLALSLSLMAAIAVVAFVACAVLQ